MDGLSEAIGEELAELAGLVLVNETLGTTLQRVADLAVRAIPACDAAGVSFSEQGRVETAAVSGPLVTRVDEHQYATGQGPCLETLSTGEPTRSPSMGAETRWPAFTLLAAAEGVISALSIPLVFGDGSAGALNLYSRVESFTEHDQEIGLGFAPPASAAVANARAYAKAQELIEQLEQALQSRDVIGQAKGIIRARQGCSDVEAFDLLRSISQHRNVKLRDIAQAIVDSPDTALDSG